MNQSNFALNSLLGVLIFFGTSVAWADQERSLTDKVSMGTSFAWYDYDGNTMIDSGLAASANFGYVFADNWAWEAVITAVDSKQDQSDIDSSTLQLHWDFHYYLQSESSHQAYLAFGFGLSDTEIQATREILETELNFGMGILHFLSPELAFRTDARVFNSFDDRLLDYSLSVGFIYFLDKNWSIP